MWTCWLRGGRGVAVISASCSSPTGNATSIKIEMDFGKPAKLQLANVTIEQFSGNIFQIVVNDEHGACQLAKIINSDLSPCIRENKGAHEREENRTVVSRNNIAEQRKRPENSRKPPEMHTSISAKQPPASSPTERQIPTPKKKAKLTATTAANTGTVVAHRQLIDGPLSWGQLKTSCESSACDISNGGCTIVLSEDFVMGSYTSEISFSGKAITIWGQGKVLDASGGGRFFNGVGSGSFLELHDAVLQNGYAAEVSECVLVIKLFWHLCKYPGIDSSKLVLVRSLTFFAPIPGRPHRTMCKWPLLH
jgi:hypothetical protein